MRRRVLVDARYATAAPPSSHARYIRELRAAGRRSLVHWSCSAWQLGRQDNRSPADLPCAARSPRDRWTSAVAEPSGGRICPITSWRPFSAARLRLPFRPSAKALSATGRRVVGIG